MSDPEQAQDTQPRFRLPTGDDLLLPRPMRGAKRLLLEDVTGRLWLVSVDEGGHLQVARWEAYGNETP